MTIGKLSLIIICDLFVEFKYIPAIDFLLFKLQPANITMVDISNKINKFNFSYSNSFQIIVVIYY